MTKFFTKDGDEYKEVEAFTQADVDEIVEKRLARERNKYSDYEDLKQKAASVDELKSQYEEKLKAEAEAKANLESQLQKANLEVDRVRIVHEFKLSDELAEFVTGDSVEDMRKRAEKLANGIKPGVTIDKKEAPEGKKSDSAKIADTLFGTDSD